MRNSFIALGSALKANQPSRGRAQDGSFRLERDRARAGCRARGWRGAAGRSGRRQGAREPGGAGALARRDRLPERSGDDALSHVFPGRTCGRACPAAGGAANPTGRKQSVRTGNLVNMAKAGRGYTLAEGGRHVAVAVSRRTSFSFAMAMRRRSTQRASW